MPRRRQPGVPDGAAPLATTHERSLDPIVRHRHGAHYTAEPDILRVIHPTIVDPWRHRIATTPPASLPALRTAFQNFSVLDPACGTGNFLLVARRELERLAAALATTFTTHQLHGIDRDPEAAAIARQLLPGADIRTADALLTAWPRPTGELAIIGNPPYLGVRKLRRELGDDLIEQLFARYPHNRAADLATYWFTRAREHLRPGERAGYVCTNSISRNTNRAASLDRILAEGGTITDAWPSYPWPGDAVVHVSIVNWISGPHPGPAQLAGRPVAAISSRLTATTTTPAKRLPANAGLCFMGVTPGSSGFILDPTTAEKLITRDPSSAAIIVPFLIGRDISRHPTQSPSRSIIDFATHSLTEARRHPAALAHVRRHVRPGRRQNPREAAMPHWWQFWRPAPALREALARTRHVLVIPSLAPHLLVVRQPSHLCFDHQLLVVTLADAYHLGVLQSRLHEIWARAHGSTLKTDLRYTPSTVFETFPFPPHPDGHHDPRGRPKTPLASHVAACATRFDRLRRKLCQQQAIGLTALHNQLPRPGTTPLHLVYAALNDAVTACYGFPPELWRDDDATLSALLNLNARYAASSPSPPPRPATPSPPARDRAAAAAPRRSRDPRR
jgi:SAM-dependent methyltransferase